MASSISVIARYDDQLVDVIDDGKNGFFFKNEDELPKLILDAMEMDLDVLKENALKKANEYSGETFAKKVLEVYKQAILIKEYTYTVVSIFPIKNNICFQMTAMFVPYLHLSVVLSFVYLH